MCDLENVHAVAQAQAAPRPRFHVGANKSLYFGADFDTVEDAIDAAARLAHEGYDLVTIRDNTSEAWAI